MPLANGDKIPYTFFPGTFTNSSAKELCQLDGVTDKFNRIDVKMIGISCDSPFLKTQAPQITLTSP
jgi:peroxiredoxin